MDIVYSPQETRLLREAKQVGCKTVNGAYMLLYQGVAQFELWTGRKAPVDIMREKLFSKLDLK
jgi:shikimate dehydrogenase